MPIVCIKDRGKGSSLRPLSACLKCFSGIWLSSHAVNLLAVLAVLCPLPNIQELGMVKLDTV